MVRLTPLARHEEGYSLASFPLVTFYHASVATSTQPGSPNCCAGGFWRILDLEAGIAAGAPARAATGGALLEGCEAHLDRPARTPSGSPKSSGGLCVID